MFIPPTDVKFILDGTTIHSAFDFDFGDEHIPLGDKKLAEMRNHLQHLKLVIIDEISFLKPDMIYKILMRLCEIFQTKALFGGKGIILVGDLLQVNELAYTFTSTKCMKMIQFYL